MYPPPPAYSSMPLNAPNMYVAQPGYPGMPMAVPDSKSGLAIAGLVLGIISMVAWLLPICGFPISIVGIVLSGLGMGSTTRKTMATIGLVLSIVALALALGNSVLGLMINAGQ